MDGRKHIFSDLKPYVCLFAECDLRMFADPYTWFDHELQEHRVEWCCQFCNHPPYHSLERFNSHMHAHHGQKFTETQLPTVAKLCQQPIETIAASDCPFCEVWETGLRVINPHEYTSLPYEISSIIDLFEQEEGGRTRRGGREGRTIEWRPDYIRLD
jgi:hypothetical protein